MGKSSGVFGYLMGVLGYLMGVPIKYPRTPIKYPKRRRPEADILGGCGGAAAPPRKSGGGLGGPAGPPSYVFSYCRASAVLALTNRKTLICFVSEPDFRFSSFVFRAIFLGESGGEISRKK